jgi:hypothetical protein
MNEYNVTLYNNYPSPTKTMSDKPRREPKGRHAFREFVMAYYVGENAAGRKITYKQALMEASKLWNANAKRAKAR